MAELRAWLYYSAYARDRGPGAQKGTYTAQEPQEEYLNAVTGAVTGPRLSPVLSTKHSLVWSHFFSFMETFTNMADSAVGQVGSQDTFLPSPSLHAKGRSQVSFYFIFDFLASKQTMTG